MASPKSSKWVTAAEHLCRHAPDTVPCPDCGETTLKVSDKAYGIGADKGIERYMHCTNCSAFHIISVRLAGLKKTVSA